MSPSCPSFSLKSDDYVRMDHIYPGPSQPPQSESLPSGVLSPAQRRSSHIFGRLFKKGNRHKADYVFVDFERDNYMDMGRIQDKNWKFLTYFPKHKKLGCWTFFCIHLFYFCIFQELIELIVLNTMSCMSSISIYYHSVRNAEIMILSLGKCKWISRSPRSILLIWLITLITKH